MVAPRNQGARVLCAELTNTGMNDLDEFTQNTGKEGPTIASHVSGSSKTYYTQIPFEISPEDTVVVDFRTEQEVTSQLRNIILSGDADQCWI